jgi:hypothetical protein
MGALWRASGKRYFSPPRPTPSNRVFSTTVSVAGKRIFEGRDKEPERASKVQERRCGDRISLSNPPIQGLFDENREISVRMVVGQLQLLHCRQHPWLRSRRILRGRSGQRAMSWRRRCPARRWRDLVHHRRRCRQPGPVQNGARPRCQPPRDRHRVECRRRVARRPRSPGRPFGRRSDRRRGRGERRRSARQAAIRRCAPPAASRGRPGHPMPTVT